MLLVSLYSSCPLNAMLCPVRFLHSSHAGLFLQCLTFRGLAVGYSVEPRGPLLGRPCLFQGPPRPPGLSYLVNSCQSFSSSRSCSCRYFPSWFFMRCKHNCFLDCGRILLSGVFVRLFRSPDLWCLIPLYAWLFLTVFWSLILKKYFRDHCVTDFHLLLLALAALPAKLTLRFSNSPVT